MSQYRVDTNKLELKVGSFFTTIPKFDLEEKDLALFDFGGLLIVGRWIPDFDGSNWIKIPGYLIRLTGDIIVSIIGLVIPMASPRYPKFAGADWLIHSGLLVTAGQFIADILDTLDMVVELVA